MLLLSCTVILSNVIERTERIDARIALCREEAALLVALSTQCHHRFGTKSKVHVCEQKPYLVEILSDNYTIGVLSLLQVNNDTAILVRGSTLQVKDRDIVYSRGLSQIKKQFPEMRKLCTTCHEDQKDMDVILKNNNFQECLASGSEWPKDILPPNPGQKGYVLEYK